MVAVKVMVVRVATLGVPRLPTLKVPLAVAAAGLLGVPGWGLADEVPKPAHSQGLAQVIVLLLHVRTQRGLLQGHPDLWAQTASPKAPGPTKAPHPPQLQALGGGGEASSLRLQQPPLPVPRLGSASCTPRTWEERGSRSEATGRPHVSPYPRPSPALELPLPGSARRFPSPPWGPFPTPARASHLGKRGGAPGRRDHSVGHGQGGGLGASSSQRDW